MERRKFARLAASAAASAALVPTIFQSCMSNEMEINMGANVKIREGSYSELLTLPFEAGGDTELTAGTNSSEIVKDKITKTLSYGASILGPTIRVYHSQKVSISFQNNLNEKTNVHWHGLVVPADMDGHPESLVQPGESFDYSFIVNQRAGTYWYHPHPHGKTGKQVHNGMAGMLIVNDDEETALNLPSGDFEVPLIIQDKHLLDGQLNYTPNMMDIMTGYLGETLLVNGVAFPFFDVAATWYRFRVLNGSTARVYNIALSNGDDFFIIGSDGGLLSTPARVNQVLLGPGERLDVLVNFSGLDISTEIFLMSKNYSGSMSQGLQEFRILKFVVTAPFNGSFILPDILSDVQEITIPSGANVRRFELDTMDMAGMMSLQMHTINGSSFDINRIDERVQAGATEIWEFVNEFSNEIHPIHIHGLQFLVVSRVGGRNSLIASEKGWKDTVLLMPGETVRLIMTFPENKGKFVFHCHNLEHEDGGMMLNFEIV